MHTTADIKNLETNKRYLFPGIYYHDIGCKWYKLQKFARVLPWLGAIHTKWSLQSGLHTVTDEQTMNAKRSNITYR